MSKQFLIASLLLAACGQSSGETRERGAAAPRGPPTPRPRSSPAAASGRPSATWRRCRAWSRRCRASPAAASPIPATRRWCAAAPAIWRRCGSSSIRRGSAIASSPRASCAAIDPTDSGGQFCDRGESYRTAIFALDAGQRRDAAAAVAEANRVLRGRVVTPVRGAARFYAAEAYHQDYARRNPGHYDRYRRGCGKDARLRAVWGNQARPH